MQVKNSFDTETLIKVAKGALLAGTGAAALYLLDWAGQLEIGVYAPLIAAVVPILVNVVKEYIKGN